MAAAEADEPADPPPPPAITPGAGAPDPDALEAGRLLFAKPCGFVAGAARAEQLPPPRLPEVAVAGRSNVGKSSLLNALTGRTALARVSHTPGRTREVNFFDLDGRLMLTDLPGYGYAAASKALIANWSKLIDAYLTGRPNLRRVLLLIDARHGLKESDRRVMARLDKAAVSYQIVLTKADKPKAEELARVVAAIGRDLATHVAAHPDILVTSARTGLGIPELRAAVARLADWSAEVNTLGVN